jgi:hypothetical protein
MGAMLKSLSKCTTSAGLETHSTGPTLRSFGSFCPLQEGDQPPLGDPQVGSQEGSSGLCKDFPAVMDMDLFLQDLVSLLRCIPWVGLIEKHKTISSSGGSQYGARLRLSAT